VETLSQRFQFTQERAVREKPPQGFGVEQLSERSVDRMLSFVHRRIGKSFPSFPPGSPEGYQCAPAEDELPHPWPERAHLSECLKYSGKKYGRTNDRVADNATKERFCLKHRAAVWLRRHDNETPAPAVVAQQELQGQNLSRQQVGTVVI